MNKFLLLFSIIILVGCKSEGNSKGNIKKDKTLPQFKTVKGMLENSSDYYVENGSLKFISEDESNLHVQVSKLILNSDSENVKNDISKRDIIYVAFQAFAQTDIDKLTITSIPNDMQNPKKYYEKYKNTVTIDRAKATLILKKYFNNEDFSILYVKDDELWLPNKNFNKLKFEKMNEIFTLLVKE